MFYTRPSLQDFFVQLVETEIDKPLKDRPNSPHSERNMATGLLLRAVLLTLTCQLVFGTSSTPLQCSTSSNHQRVGECFQKPSSYNTLPFITTNAACCAACAADQRCGLWTLRTNTTLNPGCFLKPFSPSPTIRHDSLCTSGEKGGGPTPPPSPPPPTPAPLSLTPPPTYWCTWLAQSHNWMDAGGAMSDAEASDKQCIFKVFFRVFFVGLTGLLQITMMLHLPRLYS